MNILQYLADLSLSKGWFVPTVRTSLNPREMKRAKQPVHIIETIAAKQMERRNYRLSTYKAYKPRRIRRVGSKRKDMR